MSNWTHVASIFRVDDIRAFRQTELDFQDIFGKECLWESDSDIWDDAENNPTAYLPMGSEGSLEMSIWTNSDKCQMAAYTVSIFGDLRDHDSIESIVEWFKEKCTKASIRNACVTITNEYYGTKMVSYVPYNESFIESDIFKEK